MLSKEELQEMIVVYGNNHNACRAARELLLVVVGIKRSAGCGTHQKAHYCSQQPNPKHYHAIFSQCW